MKILVLTPRFPFPPIGGDKTHIYFILKYLSKRYEVSLLSFSETAVRQDIVDKYRDCFDDIDVIILPKINSYMKCIFNFIQKKPLQISYYQSSKMKKLIEKKISNGRFDLIFVHLIRMAEYVKDIPIPKILDMGDAQSLNYIRAMAYTTGKWSIIHRFEKELVRQYEKRIWKYFNKTLVVSPIDARYLRALDKDINVEVMPIGFDLEKLPFRLNNHSNKKICFIGNMRTFPNTDAVCWFCNEILPLIRKRIPDIEFYIVGAEPSRRVRQLSKIKNVIVTGKVDDIAKYVYDASVTVAPMRVGAGIQTKIYESMALGTPVVSTSIGLEGLECIPGRDIVIADMPINFADKVIELLENITLRTEISKNARRAVEEKYDYEKLLMKLDSIIQEIATNFQNLDRCK
ncbi:MAG: glycosyltransferase [candidate division WOR-3 bacterium]